MSKRILNGKVIKDQEGPAFFKIVERLRLLSKNTLLDKNKSLSSYLSPLH